MTISGPNANRPTSFAYSRNSDVSKSSRARSKFISETNDKDVSRNFTSSAVPSNQMIAATRTPERPLLRPVAAVRTSVQETSNGRPNIPSSRPYFQVTQPTDVRKETNHSNKLQNRPNAVMDMFANPTAGPRGKFFIHIQHIQFKIKKFFILSIL